MTRAELVRLLARRTHLPVLDDAEAAVEDAIGNRLIALIGLVGRDFDDGPLANVLRVRNAELNTDNRVTHVDSLLSLRVYSSVFRADEEQ